MNTNTWIKFSDTDDGSRGYDDIVLWTNSSIKLMRKVNGEPQQITNLYGLAGQEVFIEATLRNYGDQNLEHVRFEAWIKDEATLQFPNVQPIVEQVQSISLPAVSPPASIQTDAGKTSFSQPWRVPDNWDGVQDQTAAVDIAIHAYADDDSQRYSSYLDENGEPNLDFVNNRCDGHNSISIVTPPAGQTLPDIPDLSKGLRFGPGYVNPWDPIQKVWVEVIRVAGYRAFDAGTQAALRATPDVRHIRGLADGATKLALGRGLKLAGLEGNLATLPHALALAPAPDTLVPLRFSRYAPKSFGFRRDDQPITRAVEIPRNGEIVPLAFEMKLNDHNRPGDLYFFDIVQRLSESRTIVAGTRLVVLVTP